MENTKERNKKSRGGGTRKSLVGSQQWTLSGEVLSQKAREAVTLVKNLHKTGEGKESPSSGTGTKGASRIRRRPTESIEQCPEWGNTVSSRCTVSRSNGPLCQEMQAVSPQHQPRNNWHENLVSLEETEHRGPASEPVLENSEQE